MTQAYAPAVSTKLRQTTKFAENRRLTIIRKKSEQGGCDTLPRFLSFIRGLKDVYGGHVLR